MIKIHQNKMITNERVEQMVSRLKEGDHRITPQRLAIFKILANSVEHPSAETIYGSLVEHYPTMSLATVYKTLSLLKQEGEVLELQFSDLGNRYDGNKPYPHPHVICTGCGEIVDPSLLDLDEITSKMMAETGFKIVAHRLDFYGICPECQGKA
ncbi:MAG: Fur family peroxide stress response transcriptional regulator [Desulforhopalus sp.]|jgi:Fur family peroxide stress response transcriptional regulator